MLLPRFKYKCRTCEEIHEGFPALVFDAPCPYYSVPNLERERRCRKSDDLCSVDDFRFVRCVLEYPIVDSNEIMSWGVWGSLSKENFELYVQHSAAQSRDHIGPFFSWFSNSLPASEYPETMSLKCEIIIRNNHLRPCLHLEPTDHPLSVEQRGGISLAKALRLAQPIISWHS